MEVGEDLEVINGDGKNQITQVKTWVPFRVENEQMDARNGCRTLSLYNFIL